MKYLVFLKIIAGLTIFSGFLYVSIVTEDPDIWWHIKVGEGEVASWTIPRLDEYSFSMAGHAWVDHEWLVDAWLWWMHIQNLWWLGAALFSMLAFTPFLFWISETRSVLGLALIMTAATFMLHLVGIRPQMISVALFFAVFMIIRVRFERGRDYFLIFPPLFLIWANLHGGFAMGLAFLGIIVFTHHAYLFFGKKIFDSRIAIRDLAILVVSALAVLINPYGVGLYQELYRVFLSSDTTKYIGEWQPALSTYIFSVVIFVSVFTVLGLSGIFRKSYPAPLFWGATVMLAAFLKSVRHGPLFLISAMPFMIAGAEKLTDLVNRFDNQAAKKRASVTILILVSAAFATFGYRIYEVENYPYPVRAVEFLKNEQNQGRQIRLFNDYGWGGYLIYHAPEIKVFIDGRMPHWADRNANGAMKDYVKVYFAGDENSWKEVFAKYQISAVLTAGNASKTGFRQKLRKRFLESAIIQRFYNFIVKEEAISIRQSLLGNGWQIVYEDEVAVVLNCYSPIVCYGK